MNISAKILLCAAITAIAINQIFQWEAIIALEHTLNGH